MPAPDGLAEDLALIGAAAREAAQIAMRYFRKDPEVWMKAGASPVSEADYAVDRFLAEALKAARPDYGWLSEETADSPERLQAARTFVVDPIDGTRAFLEGKSTWCVAIAVVEKGRPLAGVLDCPMKDEIYLAMHGGGATVNGRRVRVRSGKPLVLAGPNPMLKEAERHLPHAFRTHAYIPSLAYRIAMVANGTLDATFIKANAQDWDLAAADLVLTEAGGAIHDRFGKPVLYAGPPAPHGPMVAGSGLLLAELGKLIREHPPQVPNRAGIH